MRLQKPTAEGMLALLRGMSPNWRVAVPQIASAVDVDAQNILVLLGLEIQPHRRLIVDSYHAKAAYLGNTRKRLYE